MSSQQKNGGLPETDHDIFGEYRVVIPIALSAEQIPRGPYQKARPRNIAECPFFGHRRPASAAECCWASIRASKCWWLGASIGLGFQDSTVSKCWESWNMVSKMLWEKMGTACLDTENTPDPSTASTRKSNTQVFAVVKGFSNKFVIEKLCPSKWNMCSNRWVVDDQERLH